MTEGVYARVIEDSVAPSGIRLTTMVVKFANIVKQDLWTHRSISKYADLSYNLDVSRSTNSNRAIPTKRIIREVLHNPFVPDKWPKRSAQMHSAQGYHTGIRAVLMRHTWLKMRYVAIASALVLQWLGCHKQIANRLLDQWQYTTAIFTATEEWWLHFFALRNHYAAQDQVQDIANLAQVVYTFSAPTYLRSGEWHLPLVTKEERAALDIATCIKLSIARCARTSYAVTVSNEPAFTHEEDILLHDRLVSQVPEHSGPLEHQARALRDPTVLSGNLRGWEQFRHIREQNTVKGIQPYIKHPT